MDKDDQLNLQEWMEQLNKVHEPKPRFIVGPTVADGWHKLEVMPDVLGWIMEYGPELWRRDLMTKRTSHSTVCICVAPKMLTMIKMKWA